MKERVGIRDIVKRKPNDHRQAKELTQFSGEEVKAYWQKVVCKMAAGIDEITEDRAGLSKSWFFEITGNMFPKWKELKRKYLVMFIMTTISDKVGDSTVDSFINLFDRVRKVKVLECKDGTVFTEMAMWKESKKSPEKADFYLTKAKAYTIILFIGN